MAFELYLTKQKATDELASDLRNLTRLDEDFLIPACIFTMMGVVGEFPDLISSSIEYNELKRVVKTKIDALEKRDNRSDKKFGKQLREDYELLLEIEEKHEPTTRGGATATTAGGGGPTATRGSCKSSIKTRTLTQTKEPYPHHALRSRDIE
jgi:hypothetical protein